MPPEYAAIYERHYIENRSGSTAASSVSQRMEAWMHRAVAKDVVQPAGPTPTLEIGAGNLNHLPYEPHTRPYDVVEPFDELYEVAEGKERIRTRYQSIFDIGPTNYDRVTSIAVFEHIEDLPAMIAKAVLLLNDGGVLRAAFPSEGTVLWTVGWRATTAVEFKRRYGLDYRVLMQHEHVNSAKDIVEVLHYFFEAVRVRAFGPIRALSFYQFAAARGPRVDRARSYLAG